MISLKTFHLFFIAVSTVLGLWYGIFEITTPTNPGLVSFCLGGCSLAITAGLCVYGLVTFKKFKQIS
ncbi:uncharacterized protein METZ01_LOCUS431651 [marine metagenome]|uniref:Uncharacterized protein n=1 Tax=marine metagenome TaxID=408172 RepID=A0A382Y635_9ZZZZ